MTERLDRLQRRNLITRRPAARDRRSIHVELTTAGRNLIDQAITDLLSAEAGLLDGLPAGDRTTLARLLGKLAASLEHRRDGGDDDG